MLYKTDNALRFRPADFEAALKALNELRHNPAYLGDAGELLADFFDTHANLAHEEGDQDQSLLLRLRALTFSKSKKRTSSLAELIGSEFAQQAIVIRSPHRGPTSNGHRIKVIDQSRDHRFLLTISGDNTARVLLADSKKEFCSPILHEETIYSAVLRQDGLMVLAGGENGISWLSCIDSSPQSRSPRNHITQRQRSIQVGERTPGNQVGVVAFSPNGRMFLAGCNDGTVRVWQAESALPVGRPLTHKAAVISASFLMNGKGIFTICLDGKMRFWDAHSGRAVGPILSLGTAIRAVALDQDEEYAVTASDDGTARLWRVDSGQLIGQPMKHSSWVGSVAFSPDGETILTGSADGTIRLWSAKSTRPIQTIQFDDRIKRATFSPDGKRIVALTSSSVHTLNYDGKKAERSTSCFLYGIKLWVNGLQFEDDYGNQIKLVVGAFADSLRVITLHLDQQDAMSLQGDPEAALIEWQNILGLRINESGKIESLYAEASQKQTRRKDTTMTNPTGRTFISYRRSRLEEIGLLINALHDRGVPTWQDLSNLGMGQAEESLRKTLADSLLSGGILWLTPDVADSPMIRKVEMPALLNRSRNDEAFTSLLVAAGRLDYKGISELGKGYVPYDLGEFNISKVANDPINHADAASVARMVLRQRVETLHRQLPPGDPLAIDIYTGSPPPFTSGKALILDWTQRFIGGRKALPGAWEEFLLPALKDVVEAIQIYAPGRSVEATGLISIPGAVALGCAFLEPRAIKISWRPRQAPDQLWNIKAPREPSSFVRIPVPDLVNGEDLAVLVSIDNNVEPGFTKSKNALSLKCRAVTQVVNPELALSVTRHDINTPGEAAGIANVVRQSIISAQNEYPEIRRTHLFMAAPVGLAMMIGQLLNTCGMVQTYEYDRDNQDSPYQPSVLLNPTW